MTELLTLEQRHERAERRVNRFVDRFEPSYHDLVCHAALPLILTPELVSYLRNEFLREVPWIAEVDLLLSDLCSPVGYELYVMDADVRAYALTECSATFTADRKREVANLLISYVRYLAEHQSYLSDRELEAQQWAAMLCLGESERQTVVSELVARFQSAETGGTMVGANLLDHAEIARLAQLIETLKPQLTDYPELIEYAALVSDVQLRNIALERARLEKTYVVAPGQFLSLPKALQTELVAKNRIQTEANGLSEEGETLEITDIPNDIEDLETASPTTTPPHHPFPPLEPFEFIEAQLVDEEEPQALFPPPLEAEEFTIITFEAQQDGSANEGLELFEFTVATLERGSSQRRRNLVGNLFNDRSQQNTPEWVVHRQQRQAYRFIEALPGDIPLEMVSIPGGTFLMGSPEDELERDRQRESPQHEVSIEPFFMGRYLVTQAQWHVVAGLPQVKRTLDRDPSRFKGNSHPVEQVSWYDAVEFCARLSAHTRREYRLPTEAEWEYACRAGTVTPFHFGETISPELANYAGNSTYADGPNGEFRNGTTPVDHFGIANAFGLSDMHGNVLEWCRDHWHMNYDDAPADGSTWLTEDGEAARVVRGGSWVYGPRYCRSAYRDYVNPGARYDNDGFRVCCTALRKQATAPRT
jgi:formylglycine-generating enzyme required for sulfatase activity